MNFCGPSRKLRTDPGIALGAVRAVKAGSVRAGPGRADRPGPARPAWPGLAGLAYLAWPAWPGLPGLAWLTGQAGQAALLGLVSPCQDEPVGFPLLVIRAYKGYIREVFLDWSSLQQ